MIKISFLFFFKEDRSSDGQYGGHVFSEARYVGRMASPGVGEGENAASKMTQLHGQNRARNAFLATQVTLISPTLHFIFSLLGIHGWKSGSCKEVSSFGRT